MTTNAYEIWITHNAEKEKLMLPVNPETFTVTNGSKNDTVSLTGLGEIVILQSRPALVFSFSSFFPATSFPGIRVSTITPPKDIIAKINSWKESKKPVHFLITSCSVDVFASIEDFNYSENGGDPGTYQYSITLKEYREVKVRQVNVNTETKEAVVEKSPERVDNTVTPKTYTVQAGDCLWNIAKRLYGNGALYTKIYEANTDKITNANVIYTGQVLVIPEAA